MKKVIAIILSILLIFSHSAVAFAAIPGVPQDKRTSGKSGTF